MFRNESNANKGVCRLGGRPLCLRMIAVPLARAAQKGLIIENAGRYGNVIRFLVPLVITDAQLAAGLDILEEAMRRTWRNRSEPGPKILRISVLGPERLHVSVSPLPGRDAVFLFKSTGKMKLIFISDRGADIRDGQGSQL